MKQQHLGPVAVEFFEARKINPETAAKFGVYTARHDKQSKKLVAADDGNIIVFPFAQRDGVVAEKYRGPEKRFWQRANPKRIFYNWDALLDPSLEAGTQPLLIVEGEPDCLAAVDCGFPLTVSVPDGAPPDTDDMAPLDRQTEASSKFSFVYEARDQLKRIKRFVIAVDGDAAGRRLAAELVRRLGAARCAFVTYPDGCKDINDVLIKHGQAEVARMVNAAKPYPVRGLYRVSEAPDIPNLVTYSTGWSILDNVNGAWTGKMWIYPGALMLVTGIPAAGKSTWVTGLLVNLARQYHWTAAIFSPEMPMVPHYRNKLRRIIGGDRMDADQFINKSFVFIQNDPNDSDDMTLDWLLECATDAVLRDGIKVLVIDPWNEVEHAREKGESMVDYIGRSLRALKRFARQYEVLVIIIAHPTKDIVNKDGTLRKVNLYDVEGAAHWYNKCDFGIIIERPKEGNETTLYIAKVRFEETGERGAVKLRYNTESSRYENLAGGT
jgi:twinkle protein